MVQYSSQFSILEGGPKNPLKGTSMKFLVLARGAQPWVNVGSKGVKGDLQWHVGVNPFRRGGLVLCFSRTYYRRTRLDLHGRLWESLAAV